METTNVNRFEKLWNEYLDSFRGGLMEESKKQVLSFPVVKLLLQELTLSWTSGYGLNCIWLNQMLKEFPDKGKLVKEIITNDISLKEIPLQHDYSDAIRYGAPIGTGIVGATVAYTFGSSMLGIVASAIAPAAIVVPLTSSWLKSNKEKDTIGRINEYVSQLEKYKQSIIAVLLSE